MLALHVLLLSSCPREQQITSITCVSQFLFSSSSSSICFVPIGATRRHRGTIAQTPTRNPLYSFTSSPVTRYPFRRRRPKNDLFRAKLYSALFTTLLKKGNTGTREPACNDTRCRIVTMINSTLYLSIMNKFICIPST